MTGRVRTIIGGFPSRVLCWSGFCLLLAQSVQAHDPGLSAVEFQFKGGGLRADLSMAGGDVRLLVPSLRGEDEGRGLQTALAAARTQLLRVASNAFEVEWNGRRIPPENLRIQAGDSRAIHFEMTFARGNAGRLRIRSALIPQLSRGHRQYFVIRGENGELLAEEMLDASHDAFEKNLALPATPPGAARSFSKFLALGIEHILTGYDHLCFLFGLLIAGGGLREALKIITAFTLAHSITLALATLNVLNIPPRIIEPLIAASIVYVGVENIMRRDLRRRWRLSFLFGLVHGCGFASALRELGIGSDGSAIAIPLAAFNLGVELGQAAIAALILPLIWKLKSQPAFALRCAPACSLVVSLAGACLFVRRVW